MKKLLFVLLFFTPALLFSQKKEVKDKFEEYTENNVYSIDGNNIVVSRVIGDLQGSCIKTVV